MARYFAHCENTHFGQVMFECDRLMKCLGQGKDNLTQQPLRAKAKGFLTHAEFSRNLRESSSAAVWSRFWANLSTGRSKKGEFDGIPLLEPSDDGLTIWFVRHRIYIDTEQMVDPGKGLKLASSGGKQSKSAAAFADQFTAQYDEVAAEFTPFRELQELSKLVVLAEWIRDTAQPLDLELLYCDAPTGTITPKTTPSMESSYSWVEGEKEIEIRTFGGVALDPKTKMVKAPEKFAQPLAKQIAEHRSELREGKSVPVTGPEGKPRILVSRGPSARAPPVARTPDYYRLEAQGRLQHVSRFTDHQTVLGRYEMPVRTDVTTGRDMLDAPFLRTRFDARETRTAKFEQGNGRTTDPINVPASIYVTSPSRSIKLEFKTTPEFDEACNAVS